MDVRKILAQAHFERVRAERTFGLMRAGWVEAGMRAEEQVLSDAIAAEVDRAVAEEREAAADLLEALERLAQSVEKSAEYEDYCPHCDEYPGGDWDHEDDCPLVAARAAIAKARGTNHEKG